MIKTGFEGSFKAGLFEVAYYFFVLLLLYDIKKKWFISVN